MSVKRASTAALAMFPALEIKELVKIDFDSHSQWQSADAIPNGPIGHDLSHLLHSEVRHGGMKLLQDSNSCKQLQSQHSNERTLP